MYFDIDDTIGYVVNRTAVLLRQELQRRFRAINQRLAAEEWALMGQLWKEDGLSRQQLADRTIKDQTTVTRLLDALVHKDLVRREQDRKDRRIVRIWLTPSGQMLESQLVPLARALMDQVSEGISDQDIAVTLRTLRRMQENVLDK
jgi:MarR family transcriptional regulator, organic hydroperoxide resistance regulator